MSGDHFDADTIHAVAELLFEAAAEHRMEYVTDFNKSADLDFGTKSSEVIVPFSMIPETLRSKLDADVERQVIAYLNDLGIAVHVTNYAQRGRSFHVAVPPELIGRSWQDLSE